MTMLRFAVHLLAVCTLMASPAAAAASPGPPRLPSLDTATSNPWLKIGIESLSRGLFNVTIEIAYEPTKTIEDINLIHQGMGLAGWDFVSETSVQHSGTTSAVFLTYRRRPR